MCFITTSFKNFGMTLSLEQHDFGAHDPFIFVDWCCCTQGACASAQMVWLSLERRAPVMVQTCARVARQDTHCPKMGKSVQVMNSRQKQ